jgi:hypothetical protein
MREKHNVKFIFLSDEEISKVGDVLGRHWQIYVKGAIISII